MFWIEGNPNAINNVDYLRSIYLLNRAKQSRTQDFFAKFFVLVEYLEQLLKLICNLVEMIEEHRNQFVYVNR